MRRAALLAAACAVLLGCASGLPEEPVAAEAYKPTADPAVRAAFRRLYDRNDPLRRIPSTPFAAPAPERGFNTSPDPDVDVVTAALDRQRESMGEAGCRTIVTSDCNRWWEWVKALDPRTGTLREGWTPSQAGGYRNCVVDGKMRDNRSTQPIGPSYGSTWQSLVYPDSPPTFEQQLDDFFAAECRATEKDGRLD